MKKKFLVLVTVFLALVLVLSSCTPKKEVSSIAIIEETVTKEYYVGDTPDFSSIKVVVTYDDGSAETVGADALVIGGVDTSTEGKKTLTVKYKGVEATLEINVVPKAPTLTGIAIVPGSVPTSAFVGDAYDVSAIQVEATYSDGSKKAIAVAELEITTVDTASAGTKTLTVKYGGKTANIDVSVVGVKSIQIYAGTLASKVFVGGTLDTAQVQALVTYTDNSTETVGADKLTFSSLDTSAIADKVLEITYRGFKVEHSVKVVGVVDLEVENVPSSVRVFADFDLSDISVKAVYSDSTKLPVDNGALTIVNISTATAGTKTVSVTYAGITKNIEVTVVGVKSIEVVSGTLKNEVLLGGTVVLTDVKVNVTYTDNSTETAVGADKLTFNSVSTATAGVVDLEITYLDKTVQFPITVCGYKGIRVTGIAHTVKAGETLDLSAMKVYLVYEDSLSSEIELTEGITTNIADLDFDVEGEKQFVVTYNGTYGEFTSTVLISATEPDLTEILVENYTKNVGYKQTYSTIDTIRVIAVYANGARVQIEKSDLVIGTVDTTVAGDKVLTVSYTERGITKTAELAVKVLPITELKVSGIASKINKGENLDISAATAIVTFGTGSDKIEIVVDTATGLVIGALDPAAAGDTTITASYEGFEINVPVHVKAMTSMTILPGSVPEYMRPGYADVDVNTGNIKLEITYTDSTKRVFGITELAGANATVSDAGLVSVSYTGDNGTMTATAQVEVLTIVSINALNGTVPTTILKGGVLDYNSMHLTVIYKNANKELLAYAINNKDSRLTISTVDTSTTGEKAIVFTFAGFNETATIVITVKGVENITLVDGTINTIVNVNSAPGATLDTSGIQVRVEFSDGTYLYADTTDINLTVGSVDISTEGTKILVVSYLDKEVAVEIQVKSFTSAGKVFGSSLPDTLDARDTYKKNFKNQASMYVVGDDNPYYFYLNLLMLNSNDWTIVDVDGSKVEYNAKIYIIEGVERELVGEELALYVSVDSQNNSYDFTEAAINKVFRIEIWPKDETTYGEGITADSLKKSHTVKIVDAYNIYDEKELNIISNVDHDVNGNKMEGYLSYMTAVNNFLAQHEIARPERLAGIVLHRNLNITTDHIPLELLYEYKVNGRTEYGVYDQVGLFKRTPTIQDPTFTMWGNYYSVFSYNVPCIVPNGVANNDDEFSSSEVFHFDSAGMPQIEVDAGVIGSTFDYDEKKYNVIINDMAFRDNDPNSNDQSASERHMRGLIGLKFRALVGTLNNVNMDAYYISTCIEADDTQLNINTSKLYNAWQGHIFVWNKNNVQNWYGSKTDLPYANYDPVTINITDSLVAKCGGPAILCQADEKSYAYNRDSGTYVTVDDKSQVYSYVTGQEAWFVAVGQTAMAADIKSLNALISGFSQQYVTNFAQAGVTLKPASFTSKDKIEGAETMNFIMVVMGTSVGSDEGYIGKLTINGKTVLDTTADNEKLTMYKTAAETGYGQMPIFQSSDGGTCYYNAVPGVAAADMLKSLASDPNDSPYGAYLGATQPDVPCFTGDYLTLVVSGIGLCLDYYH